jgi:hypothetical protein
MAGVPQQPAGILTQNGFAARMNMNWNSVGEGS